MAQKGEKKRKESTDHFWKRSFTYFISLFCAPSISQITHRLNVELDKPHAKEITVKMIQTYTFQILKQAGANLTLEGFVSSFVEKKVPLNLWCALSNLPDHAPAATFLQTIWENIEKA